MSGHRNQPDIRVEIEIVLISAIGCQLTWFSCDGAKLTWLLWGSKLATSSFLCGGRNRLGFCMRAENDSVLL